MMRTFVVCTILVFWFLAVNCSSAQELKIIEAEGTAMSPSIRDGDKIVIDRNFYSKGWEVQRFDIVAFKLSEEQKKQMGRTNNFLFYIKRIVGLPNEKFEIKKGQIFINDKLLNEPFEKEIWEENNFGPITIPQNEYFVLGDNRAYSADSRIWEPATIKKEDILGKVKETIPAKK